MGWVASEWAEVLPDVAMTTSHGAWGNFTLRMLIPASAMVEQHGRSTRLTLQAGPAFDQEINAMWVGHGASTGNPYSFEEAPVQVTFNGGLTTCIIETGTTLVTDEVDFVYDPTKPLLVSFYFPADPGADAIGWRAADAGHNSYFISGNDAATQVASGYTLYETTRLYTVRNVEVWTGGAVTRNPASLALFILRGPALFRPVADEDIDLDAFGDWHVFCDLKGLKYDRVHDFDATLGETLAAVAAAGRAVVRHDGRKWTVVIDRPRDLVVDHINPRNASNIRASASYFEPPHALRVPFLDETNDYQEAERIVPWPGHTGDITITEELRLLGKTDPDEVWVEARRRMYEMLHRSVVYSATQQGTARSATSGDLVMASRDILRRVISSGRVVAVRGNLVELDEALTMEEGETYAIRFRQVSEDDTVGDSIVRTVANVPGETTVVHLTGTGELPVAGDLVHFGPSTEDSIPLILAGIERGRAGSSVLRMLPAAEVIDELTDAEVAPAWNGRVGDEVADSLEAPAVPVITAVQTGFEETGDANGIVVLLEAGTGSSVPVATFQVRHRLSGAGVWEAPVSGTVASGSVSITTYTAGDSVELAARALSEASVVSDWGATVTVEVGDDETDVLLLANIGEYLEVAPADYLEYV